MAARGALSATRPSRVAPLPRACRAARRAAARRPAGAEARRPALAAAPPAAAHTEAPEGWLEPQTLSFELGGQEVSLETGRVGRLADATVVARVGETVLFVTACCAREATGDGSFAPLSVQYQEKFSAAGRTSGSFLKREGKLRDDEVLTCRLIDRPLRPLMPKGWAFETQLLANVMSYDGQSRPEPLAITASGAAMCLSSVPITTAVVGVRVGRIDGDFVINPTTEQQAMSDLDLVMAGTRRAVLMIEGFADFLPEETLLEALELGHAEIAQAAEKIEAWAAEVGKPKYDGPLMLPPEGLLDEAREAAGDMYSAAMRVPKKQERGKALGEANAALRAALTDSETGESRYKESDVQQAIKQVTTEAMRRMLREEGLRSDGRGLDDVRPIRAEASFLPRTHGSALFTRGETQTMAVCTLGGKRDSQLLDDLDGGGNKHFYLQYSFPPSSVGEVGRTGAPGRREIGHGALAEKALRPALPTFESGDWGYVTRVESNITESNGSSSMASVCGGCLAMEDAGVPLRARVAGVAMGLVLPEEGGADEDAIILTDILGSEDALGEMDFKIAGSEEGVTAFQMDIVEGITIGIMRRALEKAKHGRTHILGEMAKCNPPPRGELAESAPRIVKVPYPQELRAKIIGKGGETIQRIIAEAGVTEMSLDDGVCTIIAPDGTSVDKAVALLKPFTEVPEVGKVYENVMVKKVTPFGAFVEIVQGQDGLIHISDVAVERIDKVEDVLKEGDVVSAVMCVMITEKGQVRLSRKACLPGGDKTVAPAGPSHKELKAAAEKAAATIEIGQEFSGVKVVAVMPYGCFVSLSDGVDGLLHVSQFSEGRNGDARDYVQEGQTVDVVVEGRNDKGKLQLAVRSAFA